MRGALTRRVLLAIDAAFGLLLLVVAFGGVGLPRASAPLPSPEPEQRGTAEVATRFGGLWPPGQTTALAQATDGSLAIIDRGRQIVMRLDPAGRPIAEWGPHFGPDLEAKDLVGIASDEDGWYVLDRGALRIMRLDASGRANLDRTIDLGPLATYGPTALATDSEGNLYVADTGRDRVLVFNGSGQLALTAGEPGRELGQLKQPMALGFAPDGALFVSDWENSRVQRLAGPELRATHAWPVPAHAWGITVDPLGRVIVPDGDRRMVRLFSAEGSLLAEIGGGGGPSLPVEFPSQVAVSPDGGTLWVLGRDALARVDLAPYAALQPPPVQITAEPVRLPLALLGFALLAVAGGAAVWPRRPRTADAPVPRARAAPRVLEEQAPAARGALSALGVALLGLGLALASYATLQLLDALARAEPWPRLALLVLGGLVFGLGVQRSATTRPLTWVAEWPVCAGKRVHDTFDRVQLGLFAASGVGLLAAAVVWWQFRFQTPEATRGVLVWLVAVALFAASSLRWVTRSRLAQPEVWVVPLAVFVLALVPRIWNNAELPYGIWFDEAQAGLEARRLLQEGRFMPITDTYGRDAAGFYYLLAAVLTVVQDPVVASRGLAAVLGALNVPLVYFLGRELFGWRVGLATAVLLAASRWHLDVSRLGWGPITLPLCVTLAVWLTARAVRTGRLPDAVWAGMAMGLGMHGYIGFRVFPFLAFGLLVLGLWRYQPRPAVVLSRAALAAAAALALAMPVVIFALQDPAGFNGRLGQTLIWAQDMPRSQMLDELWGSVQKHALMFHVSGDMNGRHNLPGLPMLDAASGLLAVLGLAWLACRPRDWRTWLVFAWGVAAMSGGVLTLAFEAPQAMRTLAMTPLLALLAAVGLVLLADRAFMLLPRREVRTFASAAAAAVLVGVTGWHVNTFFAQQMADPTVWESFSTRETVPARAAAAEGAQFEAILGSATIAPSVQADLLARQWRDKIRVFDPIGDLPYRTRGPLLVFLETEHDAALVDEVARYYPDAARRPIIAPNGRRPLVEELRLDRAALAAQRGLMATYVGADGTTVLRRETSALLASEAAPVPLPARVSWRAAIAVTLPGVYALRASDGFTLTLNETPLASDSRVELVRGNHLLTAQGTLNPGSTLSVSWQPPDGDQWRTLDAAVLFVAPEGGNGLTATYFPTQTWDGVPRESVIEPLVGQYYHLSPLRRVAADTRDGWSAEWRGFIDVPTSGTYGFQVERVSRAGLWIDERVVFDETPEDAPEVNFGSVALAAGRHAIRVRLQNRNAGGPRLYLYWIPPGGQREVVPGRALYPVPPAIQ